MPKLQINDQIMDVKSGSELTEIADKRAELPLKFGCRRGQCGVCALEVAEGDDSLTKKSDIERETLIKKGLDGEQYRLGCQCAINGPVAFKTIRKNDDHNN